MQKRLLSTVLLFAIGVGFGIYSVSTLVGAVQAHRTDDIIQALLYMVPAIVAFAALIMLPFRSQPTE